MKTDELEKLPPLVREYFYYVTGTKNQSRLTALEYASDLQTFFRFIKVRRKLVDGGADFDGICISDVGIDIINSITYNDAIAFLSFCNLERGNNSTTRARKASSLRGFYKYLLHTNKIDVNPLLELETPKKKKALPKYLSLDQSLSLLDCVDGKFKERDYCILTLFLNCGLRLQELVDINVTSILGDGSLKVLGKGNKERIVYLNDACRNAVEAYLAVRPNDGIKDKKALFISRQNQRISPKTVQFIVKKYLEKSGLADYGFSVHKLRHTAATLMYRYGEVDIMLIKEILGHENLGTTQIYTHVANEQMKAAIDKNPLSNVKNKE